MNKIFIGIDFSKEKFDATLIKRDVKCEEAYDSFPNTEDGFKLFIKWVKSNSRGTTKQDWLFCGENTGLYSVKLSIYLAGKGYFMWLEHALEIKYSMGVRREKTDKADSRCIAMYAMRHEDKARRFTPKSTTMQALEILLSRRDLLVKMKGQLNSHATEMRAVYSRNPAARYDYEKCMNDLERYKKEIKETNKKILEEIERDEEVKENYQLITSIKGIGPVNAIAFIIYTGNFTRFATAKQLACYCGVVPFSKQSGTSVHSKPKISRFANKNLKTYLTEAAKAAVKHDKELREYYQRMLGRGKDRYLVLNNVRNKLVRRIMAVIRDRTAFDDNYRNPYELKAS